MKVIAGVSKYKYIALPDGLIAHEMSEIHEYFTIPSPLSPSAVVSGKSF